MNFNLKQITLLFKILSAFRKFLETFNSLSPKDKLFSSEDHETFNDVVEMVYREHLSQEYNRIVEDKK